MKEINSLATQLRSWKLRGPSPRLRRQLFPAPSARREYGRALCWFAPAAACALLAFSVLIRQDGAPSRSFRSQPVMAGIASNKDSVSGLSGTVQRAASNFCPVAFDWTNHAGPTSSIGSYLRGMN